MSLASKPEVQYSNPADSIVLEIYLNPRYSMKYSENRVKVTPYSFLLERSRSAGSHVSIYSGSETDTF